jgi:hypothetical protein
VIASTTFWCTISCVIKSSNFETSRCSFGGACDSTSSYGSSSHRSSSLDANPWPLNCDETCSHLASRLGADVLRNEKESVQGLVDGIRVVDATARKALDIEAGPLLQALNMVNTVQQSSKTNELLKD